MSDQYITFQCKIQLYTHIWYSLHATYLHKSPRPNKLISIISPLVIDEFFVRHKENTLSLKTKQIYCNILFHFIFFPHMRYMYTINFISIQSG